MKKTPVSLRSVALKWFRTKGNIQAEVEEMQEEQRSLSSMQTLSVCSLLMDSCVRWQVLTVAVVNIGMQLSGIDAVSRRTIVLFFSSFVYMCVYCHILNVQQLCSYYMRGRSYSARVPSWAPPVHPYITVSHPLND